PPPGMRRRGGRPGRRTAQPAAGPGHRPPDTGAAPAADGWAVLEQAAELTRRGDAFALATVVWRQGPSSGQQGSRAIITASGELRGWIGGAGAEPVGGREGREGVSTRAGARLLLGTPAH